MNAPLRLHPTLSDALRQQAMAVYAAFRDGHESTALAMLNQIPHERTAYAVMTMTVHAVHDGCMLDFSRFIEGATR